MGGKLGIQGNQFLHLNIKKEKIIERSMEM